MINYHFPKRSICERERMGLQDRTRASENKVSVIIPAYNVESSLDECLSSVRAQTHRDLEIICLNDGSTDGSLDIMRKHAAEDDRVVVVDKKNEGYGATCNRGIDLARGGWIAIVEPDDWIEPLMYERMLAFASSLGAQCDIVKTPYWRVIDADTPDEHTLHCKYHGRVNPKRQPFAVAEAPALIRYHPSIWSALYRSRFLREKGIRFHEIPGAGWADNPFLMDTLCQTNAIVYLDEPFYHYRENTPEQEERMILRDPLMPLSRWSDILDILEQLGIADEAIVEETYRKGFNYFWRTTQYTGRTEEVMAAAREAFGRLDPDRVFASKIIAPEDKRLFAELRGIPCPKIDTGYWRRAQLQEFVYTLRSTGVKHTLKMVKKALKGH